MSHSAAAIAKSRRPQHYKSRDRFAQLNFDRTECPGSQNRQTIGFKIRLQHQLARRHGFAKPIQVDIGPTRLRAAHGLGNDPDDPRDNILAGAAYLRLMYDRFGYPGLFAAYNAGPERYAGHLATGRTLPGETRAYLARLTDNVPRTAHRQPAAPVDRLFFPITSADRGAVAPVARPSRNSLFVTLTGR